ncbi:hypothetical protein ONZ45_g13445 [Pleurotus djamor]|nr:hypothetical protein ONZ45_g13445 [Pleurotus djamor]
MPPERSPRKQRRVKNQSSYYTEHDIIKRLRKNIFFGGQERVPPSWCDVDLQRIASVIAAACANTVKLPASMETLSLASPKRRTKLLSSVCVGEVDSPTRLVSSNGYPVLYVLPGIYGHKSQMDLADASIALSPILGTGDGWRDGQRFVLEKPGDIYPHGCENFSAAWFATGQHKKPDPPKPSTSLRKTKVHKEAAEKWLRSSVVGHRTANIIIGILHHESYLHAVRDRNALRDSSDKETAKWARLWTSVFTAISVIGNRYCDEHTDSTARNELLLSQLKARIQYDPGTAVVFSGRLFLHEVPPWCVGERVGHAYFMRKESPIHGRFSLPLLFFPMAKQTGVFRPKEKKGGVKEVLYKSYDSGRRLKVVNHPKTAAPRPTERGRSPLPSTPSGGGPSQIFGETYLLVPQDIENLNADMREDYFPPPDPLLPNRRFNRNTPAEYLRAWLGRRSQDLKLLLSLESLSGEDCAHCDSSKVELFRCVDCLGGEMLCSGCCLQRHSRNPFHRIQRWSADGVFTKTSLKELGLIVKLGHGGKNCPRREKVVPIFSNVQKQLVIVHTTGVHLCTVEWCACLSAEGHYEQLMKSRLFPATIESPSTAFTFELLEELHLQRVECKSSSSAFYSLLRRRTSPDGLDDVPDREREMERVSRCFRDLQARMASGIFNETKVFPGVLALFCPACPQPGRNITPRTHTPDDPDWMLVPILCADGNFKFDHLRLKSSPNEVLLRDGLAYLVTSSTYETHLEATHEKQHRSTCANHKAVNLSGTAFFVPHSVVNFKKGEQQKNMDFAVSESLKFFENMRGPNDLQVPGFLLCYDVMCQYGVHLEERLDDGFYLSKPKFPIGKAVGKFHLGAHVDGCYCLYSLNFIRGAGQTDSERIESLWAQLNKIAGPTRPMTLAHRQEIIDDCIADSNWKKLLGLRGIGEKELAAWDEAVEEAYSCRGNSLLIFDRKEGPVKTVRKVQLEISEEEGNAASIVGGADHVAEGLSIQDAQCVLKAKIASLGEGLTPSQKLDISRRRNRLGIRVRKFNARAVKMMGNEDSVDLVETDGDATGELNVTDEERDDDDEDWADALEAGQNEQEALEVEGTEDDEDEELAEDTNAEFPEDSRLFLPSSFSLPDRKNMGMVDLAEKELRLRLAQVDEILQSLRVALGEKSLRFRKQVRQNRAQKDVTRAWAGVRSYEARANLQVDKYEQALRCISSLSPEEGAKWEKIDRSKHLQMKGDVEHANRYGQQNHTLPWFWRTGPNISAETEDSPQLLEYYRINYVRAKARVDRWSEEVCLLEKEMNRTVESFLYDASRQPNPGRAICLVFLSFLSVQRTQSFLSVQRTQSFLSVQRTQHVLRVTLCLTSASQTVTTPSSPSTTLPLHPPAMPHVYILQRTMKSLLKCNRLDLELNALKKGLKDAYPSVQVCLPTGSKVLFTNSMHSSLLAGGVCGPEHSTAKFFSSEGTCAVALHLFIRQGALQDYELLYPDHAVLRWEGYKEKKVYIGSDLNLFRSYLKTFHTLRQIFIAADIRSDFALPRQHSLMHYCDGIELFGSPNGLCTSITEAKHIPVIKQPWRRSSRKEPLPQMLRTITRMEQLAAIKCVFRQRGMLNASLREYMKAFVEDRLPPPHPFYGPMLAFSDDIIEDVNDVDDSSNSTVVEGPKSKTELRLSTRRQSDYPLDLVSLASYLKIPSFPEALNEFISSRNHSGTLQLPLDSFVEAFDGRIHVFHSATAEYYSPSELCGAGGMYREMIRVNPDYAGDSRFDTVLVSTGDTSDQMNGLTVARVHLLFSYFDAYDDVRVECALVSWFVHPPTGPPRDPATGMWLVCPEIDEDGSHPLQVIHLDSILRGIHLLPCFGSGIIPEDFSYINALDAFKQYYVNHFVDYHAHELLS